MSSPIIKFSNQTPSDRNVFHPNSGSCHVTVYSDPYGEVLDETSDIGLVTVTSASEQYNINSDSVGEITNLTADLGVVDFDVVNITNYGDIIVSAYDGTTSATSLSSDTNWRYSPESNRLINLTNFLPSTHTGTEVEEFTKFFEDFLNTMYEDKDDSTNKGILKKIESIRDFNDPTEIDMDYINFFSRKLGYDVDISRGELGLFSTSGSNSYEELEGEEKENADKYLRLVVQNLPNWYRVKTTKNAIKIMLFSFGIIGDIITRFSSDYDTKWVSSIETDGVNVVNEVPYGYFPTPHFNIEVDISETDPVWMTDVGQVVDAINSIRPINTVFDGITGLYIFGTQSIYVHATVDLSYNVYVNNTTSNSFDTIQDTQNSDEIIYDTVSPGDVDGIIQNI